MTFSDYLTHLYVSKTSYKHTILNLHLYKYLTGRPNNSQTPQFYGIRKIHKSFSHLPPMRPVVSHSNSALSQLQLFRISTTKLPTNQRHSRHGSNLLTNNCQYFHVSSITQLPSQSTLPTPLDSPLHRRHFYD